MGRAIAVILLPLAIPIIALLVLLIRLTSPGPGLYRQQRVGRHGKSFTMYKLRTMYRNAEHASGPTWCAHKDPRITPVGRMLRHFHFDELPQLWNVVRGEMALVGPRPERPEFVVHLKRQIPGYQDRLAVLPGITGLAQINLPADVSLLSVVRKVELDRQYIRDASLLLDLRILACTALRMSGLRHGIAVWLLGLERNVNLLSSHRNGDVSAAELLRGESASQPVLHEPASAAVNGLVMANGRLETQVTVSLENDSRWRDDPKETVPRRPR
jgi:lipopolysaccharide/colanic/teichoic acid biosynthesis glycosyltransferase